MSKKYKHNIQTFYKWFYMVMPILLTFLVIKLAGKTITKENTEDQSEIQLTQYEDDSDSNKTQVLNAISLLPEYPCVTASTHIINDTSISGESCIVLRSFDNKVLAEKNSTQRIYPASMTKIMTLIIAVENINNLDDEIVMTEDIINKMIAKNATRVGFVDGESIKMIDLLYGAILSSGGDATMAIAEAISGSEEEFAKLMNKKAKDLGLEDTHFVNSSGLYNKDHYTTVTDMAVITEYALNNELCRQILTSKTYTTTPTPQHPNGISLTNSIFKRIESDTIGDENEIKLLGGKTGYTTESKNTLVDIAYKDGYEYIAVVAKSPNAYQCMYDTFTLFTKYIN